MLKTVAFTATLLLLALDASAGEVTVVDARATPEGEGSYRFDVTLRHADSGWEHYADGWEVLSPEGAILGKRILYHPHVDEQPFTRSLSGVRVPAGTRQVLIRAHDLVHGYGPRTFPVTIP